MRNVHFRCLSVAQKRRLLKLSSCGFDDDVSIQQQFFKLCIYLKGSPQGPVVAFFTNIVELKDDGIIAKSQLRKCFFSNDFCRRHC